MSDREDPATIRVDHVFDREFIRRGLRRDVLWLGARVSIGLVAITAGISFLMGANPLRPPMALVSGCVAAAALLLPFMLLHRFVAQTWAIWTRQSPDHRITYRLTPTALEVELSQGQARYDWSGMRRLWRYRDVWLVEVAKNHSVIFPVDAPAAAKELLVARFEEAGIRVS